MNSKKPIGVIETQRLRNTFHESRRSAAIKEQARWLGMSLEEKGVKHELRS